MSLTEFKTLELPKPSTDEQAVIGNILDAIQHGIQTQSLRLEKLRLLKTALMQDLLTGKRRVTSLLTKPEEASA